MASLNATKASDLVNLLEYSAPQCSVLGSLEYSLFKTPLLSVISSHEVIQ